MNPRLLAVARMAIWDDPRRLPIGDFRAALALRWALSGARIARA